MNRLKYILTMLMCIALLCQCNEKEDDPQKDQPADIEGSLPNTVILRSTAINTDKSAYNPGETVHFYGDRSQGGLAVRYWHLGELIEECLVEDSSEWTWTLPNADFQGYYAELIGKNSDGEIRTVGACAVDASSDWTRFPRYGFLSKFGDIAPSQIRSVLENLRDYHINGLQYYDWMYDHHHPLAGTPEKPDSDWPNLIGNVWQLSTVRGYIDTAHEYNIASMFYDLCYGVMAWAEDDGVESTWYQYNDKQRRTIDNHPLGAPFRSSLYLVDPNNPGWLDYFSEQVSDVYKVFNFDGFHIDQLGSRGTKYDYNGNAINLTAGYAKFINRMKQDEPSKKIAFNAVSNYGQGDIAKAKSDFLYTEVWNTGFPELQKILDANASYAPGKNTVFAAYMNYNKGGEFNTPAVLLTDAVMFALGADHLELGEHMLSSEYFPNENESMSPALKNSLRSYYDFLVGYENVLRDGAEYYKMTVSSDDIDLAEWGPVQGKVNCLVKKQGDRIIIHLLNFNNAAHLNWRDDDKTQKEPELVENFKIDIRSNREVGKIWIASPDINGGVPEEADFVKSNLKISVSVPSLKYWTMIVIE